MSTYETVDRPEAPIAVGFEDTRGRHRHAKKAHTDRSRDETLTCGTPKGHAGYMVLSRGPDDVAAVDMRTGAMARLRVARFGDQVPALKAFDIVEANLSSDPERDDLAHPEAVSISGPSQSWPDRHRNARLGGGSERSWPRTNVTSWVRRVRRSVLGVPRDEAVARAGRPCTSVRCCSAGRPTTRPGLASVGRGATTGCPVEDDRAISCLWAAGRDKLTGKDLAAAIGFRPRYLLVALTPPRAGHCYKTIVALLPRP